MNGSPNDSRYGKRRGGGQPGNTNGQTHGLFSRLHPPAFTVLTARVDAAIAIGDLPTLMRIERAFKFHKARVTMPEVKATWGEAEAMTRAARLLIAADTVGFDPPADPFPPDTPDPFFDDDPPSGMEEPGAQPEPEPWVRHARQEVDDWLRTVQPIHDQPTLPGIPDTPATQPHLGIGIGSRAARGTIPHKGAGQDDFPAARSTTRRRH